MTKRLFTACAFAIAFILSISSCIQKRIPVDSIDMFTATCTQIPMTATITPTAVPTTDFIHPGALDSKAELDFVKAKILASQNPWKTEYTNLASSSYASRTPHGAVFTYLNSCNNTDANTIRDDSHGAYAQALLWYYSGNTIYADRAVAILNSWQNFQGFNCGTEQDHIQAGWVGTVFADAAEILRGYSGWDAADIIKQQDMFKRAYYTPLNTSSVWNGNADLAQINAMMAISVFCEDRAEFNAGIVRLKTRVPAYFYISATPVPPIIGDGGNVQNFWYNPVSWTTGLQQETCRDNGHHSQFALGAALRACEIAWHQGTDIYTEMGPRYMPAMELLAKQFLTNDMQGCCSNNVPGTTRMDTWEVGYNHYHNRKGFAMTETGNLITTIIVPYANRADWHMVFETLTHTDVY